MTEYVLPFTCEQIIKGFKIFKWIILIGSPFMIIYAIVTNQLPLSSNESLWVHPLFSWGCIISAVSWISQILFWLMELDYEGKLPSFRCKCEPNDTPSKEEAKK